MVNFPNLKYLVTSKSYIKQFPSTFNSNITYYSIKKQEKKIHDHNS